MKEDVNLTEWLASDKIGNKTPDIYCIGLQEIVELNANNVLISSNQGTVELWKSILKRNLDNIDRYK